MYSWCGYLSHLHVFVFAYVSVFVYMCICIQTFIYICVCICTKTCICICICSVFVYVSACGWCVLILKCPSAFGMHSWCCYLPICMSSQFALSDGFRFANLHSRMDSDGFGSESQNNWHSTELREKDFGRRTYLHSLPSLIIENCSAGGIFSFCCSIQFDSFCSEICIFLISRIEVFSLHLSLHFQSDNVTKTAQKSL